MAIQYLGDGGPDGTVLFQLGQKGGFFGETTPVVRQAVATLAALTAGETTPADVAAALVELYVALEAYGLVSAA